MTTYSAIPGTDIDTDSPITESLMTKLRDNPIAITEGATGAPKVQAAAIDTNTVSFNDKIKLGTASGSWTAGTITVPRGVWNMYNAGAGTVTVQLLVNGTWRTAANMLTGGLSQQIISDGANVRLNSAGSYTVYYEELFD